VCFGLSATAKIHSHMCRHAGSLAAGLASMPALKTVSINGLGDAELQQLSAALPNSVTLHITAPPSRGQPSRQAAENGSKSRTAAAQHGSNGTEAGSVTAPATREITISEKDLSDLAVLFGALKSVVGTDDATHSRLTAQFDSHVEGVIKHLSGRLDGMNDALQRQGEILGAKEQLYDVVFQVAIEAAASVGATAGAGDGLAASLRALRKTTRGIAADWPVVLAEAQPQFKAAQAAAESRASRAEAETARLLRAAEMLEQEAQHLRADASGAEREHREEVGAIVAEKRSLARENAELRIKMKQLETQLGATRAAGAAGGSAIPPHIASPRASSPARATTRAPLPPPVAVQGGTAVIPPSQSSRGPSSGGAASGPHEAGPAGGGAAAGLSVSDRTLTLNQLREVIDAMYGSKVKFDAKCDESQLPRETMEQHLYTYLNQKYGLKNLIIEHASAVIRGVNAFSASDNDVRVFGCILRNDIDEEFRLVQRQLKNTVGELLRVYLKGKHPMKPDASITKFLQARTSGHVVEAEWVEIVRYMYAEDDAATLIDLVKTTIATKPELANPADLEPAPQDGAARGGGRRRRGEVPSREASAAQAVAAGRIAYDALLKILLDFQLRGHEKFLARFRRAFRKVDDDNNGVVDEVQFRALTKALVPGKAAGDVDELLASVDPYNNNHITFSDCVGVMSSDLVALVSQQ
jgi:hypothetical protein